MKILNICTDDWANYSHCNANALRSVGAHCVDIKFNPHPFNYTNQSRIVRGLEMINQILEADIVQIFHSDFRCLELFLKCNLTAKLIVYHTGTPYRQDSEGMNNRFNPHVSATIHDSPEFHHLGGKNIHYVPCAIDTDNIKSKWVPKDKLTFAHYPSNPDVKGSQIIIDIFSKFENINFNYSLERVPHAEQLKRMDECDVYIEMLNMEQNGKPYGSFGVTAMEAAALGKIVITNCAFPDVYHSEYLASPFYFVSNKTEILARATEIFFKSDIQIRNNKLNSMAAIESCHSYKATGERLLKIINEC